MISLPSVILVPEEYVNLSIPSLQVMVLDSNRHTGFLLTDCLKNILSQCHTKYLHQILPFNL